MLKVDEHFKAVVLKTCDGLAGHQQVLLRRRLQRLGNVEQSRLDDHDRNRNALLAGDHELYVGPVLNLGAAAACPAKQSKLHGSGIHRVKRGCQIADELVRAGKADLCVADAETQPCAAASRRRSVPICRGLAAAVHRED